MCKRNILFVTIKELRNLLQKTEQNKQFAGTVEIKVDADLGDHAIWGIDPKEGF